MCVCVCEREGKKERDQGTVIKSSMCCDLIYTCDVVSHILYIYIC